MIFKPVYILILAFTIIVDYWAGIFIEGATGRRRKWFLISSLVANIGVLAFFKYYNFLNENISWLLGSLDIPNPAPVLQILLPIGLSFHTFQAMSYTIEVYRGNQKVERHFGIYALYVMFYPQLVAGPIERPQNLLFQFHKRHFFVPERVADGLKLMAWGVFKKVVIADRLAVIVDAVYNSPYQYEGFSFVIATVFFTFQIYCDFSGYSDIAIGSARVMGFKLMRNFNSPYFSSSIAEFWRRWHISLSTWFRDYLYIPLGGSRVGELRRYGNLFLVFFVSGLWHGANWTFIIWGALHGIYQILALLRDRLFGGLLRVPAIVHVIIVFLLVSVSWIFFRAKSLSDASHILSGIFSRWTKFSLDIHSQDFQLWEWPLAVILIVFLLTVEYLHSRFNLIKFIHNLPKFARIVVYSGLVLSIFLLGKYVENSQFIYFQF